MPQAAPAHRGAHTFFAWIEMKALDSLRIFVITQRKGSLSAAARSLSLSPATISRRISALEEELGVQLVDRTSRNLRVNDAIESKAMLIEALNNKPGLPRDIVSLNAGAALFVSGVADSIAHGIEAARAAIASGDARAKLEHFIDTTQKLAAS